MLRARTPFPWVAGKRFARNPTGPSQATRPPADVDIDYAPAAFEIHEPGKCRSARDGGDGVQAQATRPDGRLVDDFHFVKGERILHVVNASSPAATASLAIGERIVAEAAGMAG